MKIGITTALWVTTKREMIDVTLRLARSARCAHPALFLVACTRLHLVTPDGLREELAAATATADSLVLHEPGVERSVAGAWNWGMGHAFAAGCDYCLVAGNDVELLPDTLDRLVDFGERHPEADVWSGLPLGRDQPEADELECCDFACFMLRRRTVERHGWFDENYRPAYFEDNDYYARVWLGGGRAVMHPAARFHHAGSLTKRAEPEAAHHVNHWWEHNRRRYCQKWGVPHVLGTPAEVLAHCHRNPWGDPSLPLTFWQRS